MLIWIEKNLLNPMVSLFFSCDNQIRRYEHFYMKNISYLLCKNITIFVFALLLAVRLL